MAIDPQLRALLDEIHRYGEERGGMWNITPETGAFFHFLLQAIGAQRALEVGTSNGYSTIWLADALARTGGRLTTLEINPDKVRLATENLRRAGLLSRVQIVQGDARLTIRQQQGPFDFIFIDANKDAYLEYLDAALECVRPGGVIAADNVRSHAEELRGFVERVTSDARLEAVELPFGGGQILAYVRPQRG